MKKSIITLCLLLFANTSVFSSGTSTPNTGPAGTGSVVEDDSNWKSNELKLDKIDVQYKAVKGKYLWTVGVTHGKIRQQASWLTGGQVGSDKDGNIGLKSAPAITGPDGTIFRVKKGWLSRQGIGSNGRKVWIKLIKSTPPKQVL